MSMGDEAQIAIAGASTFVLVAALVPVCRAVALRRGLTDQPSPRKWHGVPTPYLGGVAIACGSVASLLLLAGWRRQGATIVIAAGVISGVGLLDDVRTTTPRLRLVVEAAAAIAVAHAGARIQIFGDPLDLVVTVVFLVVFTNAFNLLDNMDGVAGSVGTATAIALAITALIEHQVLVGGLAVVVASGCLAFLLYNWPPARIFMGDAGSLFVGFLLAVIAVKLRTGVPRFASAVALALLLGAAIFDTALVVISRSRRHRPIFLGGTDHTAHRLRRIGIGPAATTGILVGGAAVSAGTGVGVAEGMVGPVVATLAIGVPASVALVALLRVPVYDDVLPSGPVESGSGARRGHTPRTDGHARYRGWLHPLRALHHHPPATAADGEPPTRG
jgi:UDP-GlcNAc:undecaprenyl-phosphate GlcNAc-1-phosphate transferase